MAKTTINWYSKILYNVLEGITEEDAIAISMGLAKQEIIEAEMAFYGDDIDDGWWDHIEREEIDWYEATKPVLKPFRKIIEGRKNLKKISELSKELEDKP